MVIVIEPDQLRTGFYSFQKCRSAGGICVLNAKPALPNFQTSMGSARFHNREHETSIRKK